MWLKEWWGLGQKCWNASQVRISAKNVKIGIIPMAPIAVARHKTEELIWKCPHRIAAPALPRSDSSEKKWPPSCSGSAQHFPPSEASQGSNQRTTQDWGRMNELQRWSSLSFASLFMLDSVLQFYSVMPMLFSIFFFWLICRNLKSSYEFVFEKIVPMRMLVFPLVSEFEDNNS